MTGPASERDLAVLELFTLGMATRYAEGRQWLRAVELIRAGRLTAIEAAQALGVRQATFTRKTQEWVEHLDAGPGVGQ